MAGCGRHRALQPQDRLTASAAERPVEGLPGARCDFRPKVCRAWNLGIDCIAHDLGQLAPQIAIQQGSVVRCRWERRRGCCSSPGVSGLHFFGSGSRVSTALGLVVQHVVATGDHRPIRARSVRGSGHHLWSRLLCLAWRRGGPTVRITGKRRVFDIDGNRVELARTADGVVQLWAVDDVALAAGLGFTHASDRLVQMMLVRLIGQGRLSECLQSNNETLAIDIFARDMGIQRNAIEDVANLEPEAARFAEAYAAGVNHFLERHRRPLELALVGYRPEPWTIADTFITMTLISYVGLAQTQQDFEKLIVEAIRGGRVGGQAETPGLPPPRRSR